MGMIGAIGSRLQPLYVLLLFKLFLGPELLAEEEKPHPTTAGSAIDGLKDDYKRVLSLYLALDEKLLKENDLQSKGKEAQKAVERFFQKVADRLSGYRLKNDVVAIVYRAKAYRLGLKVAKITHEPVLVERYTAELQSLCKRLIDTDQHPGAMEMLAESETNQVTQITLRKKAALHGCRTSFKAIPADNEIFQGKKGTEKYFKDWDELYMYGCYELLLMSALGEDPDLMRDSGGPVPLYNIVARDQLYAGTEFDPFELLVKKVARRAVTLHADAVGIWVKKRYHWQREGEVCLDKW